MKSCIKFTYQFNFMFARSAPHILPLKDKYTFCFSDFLKVGLCNSSANCWFGIILIFKIATSKFICTHNRIFFIKTYINQWQKTYINLHWYPSYFAFFAMLSALSHNTLSAAVLLGQSLNSPSDLLCWKQALSNLFW